MAVEVQTAEGKTVAEGKMTMTTRAGATGGTRVPWLGGASLVAAPAHQRRLHGGAVEEVEFLTSVQRSSKGVSHLPLK